MDKLIKLKINKLANDGEGLSIYKGKSCFIYNALPNEVVLCKVATNKRGAYVGDIKKILTKSKDRILLSNNPASLIGLTLAHYKYDKTLEYKNKKVAFHLRKVIPNFDQVINDIIKAPNTLYYRNETEVPLEMNDNKIVWGLYKPGTNKIMATNYHLQQHKIINDSINLIIDVFNKYHISVYNYYHKDGLLRKLKLRINTANELELTIFKSTKLISNDILTEVLEKIPNIVKLNLVSNNNLKEDEISGKYQLFAGDKYFTTSLNNHYYYLSYDSFFQLNYDVTKIIYDDILNLVNSDDVILDAYAGVASIGLYLASKVKKIYSVEISQKAVDAAKYGFLKNNIVNIEAVNQNLTKWYKNNQIKFNTIIFDPPRGGLDDEVISILLNKKVDKIIYLSCNIETLARDLKKLKKEYKVLSIKPYDMFPHTAHIETIVLLSKMESKNYNSV